MPLVIPCPSCKSRLKAPESLIGKMVKCPNCQTAIPVRDPGSPASAPAPAPRPKPAPAPAPAKKPAPANDFDFDDDDQPPPRKGGAVKKARDDYDDEPPRKPAKGGRRPADDEFDDLERRVDDFPDDDDDDRPKKGKGKKGKGEMNFPRATEDDKTSAFNMYLYYLIGSVVCGPVGPIVFLVMWLGKRKTSRLVDWHGKQVLNQAITGIVLQLGLGLVISLAAALFLIDTTVGGIAVAVAGGLAGLVMFGFMIVAVINFFKGMFQSKAGEYTRYMMTWQLLK